MRVVVGGLAERYSLPPRPAGAAPWVQDAYRQTSFLLADDLALFQQAMDVQLQAASAAAKRRTPEAAALFGFWSRTFCHLADGCSLLCLGSYRSCPPVLRSACDCIAAQRALIRDGFGEYGDWLANAVTQDRERAAVHIDLGRFRAGSVLAEDDRLGLAYRALTELSMPHFGSTAFQVGAEISLQKLHLAFAEAGFHLGWAELIAGWLLLLCSAQLETIVASEHMGVTGETAEAARAVCDQIAAALSSERRCYVENAGDGLLLHNFRRTPAGAPRRVLLG